MRLRKLEGGVAGRGSLELGRLVAREERLLDTLGGRGEDTGLATSTSSEASDKCGSEVSGADCHMGLVITEILLQGDTSESRGNIEIDISSMESSSEVRVVMCSRMFVLVLQKRSIRRFVITEKAPTIKTLC